jgi:hypothetical protein
MLAVPSGRASTRASPVITECPKRGATRVDVLAFEFEMGSFPAVLEEARGKGIDLTSKYIPAEVFDKRAVDRGQVVFHDISFVEATPRYDRKDKHKLTLAIELTAFSVYYTQGAAEAAIAAMREGKSEVMCEHARKSSRCPSASASAGSPRSPASNRRKANSPCRILRNAGLAATSSKTNGKASARTATLNSRPPHTYDRPGRYTVAVNVIDIFGNDTMTLMPVKVG